MVQYTKLQLVQWLPLEGLALALFTFVKDFM